MAVTRDQASRLLSESEMTLFGDSRNPALRALSARELIRRIERTRRLRDRSRDLLQRQKLGTRGRTGSKGGVTGTANERTARKGEVLDDILQRFEDRLGTVQGAGQAESPRSSASRAIGRKTAAARAGKTSSRKSEAAAAQSPRGSRGDGMSDVTEDRAAKRRAGTRKAATTAARASAAGGSTRRRKQAVSPDEALANTRQLLEAKQQRDRETPAYRMLEAQAEGRRAEPEPGFQSESARAKAQELHAGEVRLDPIHGSISTHDRQSQGERDRR